jgi:hypothetical protein
MYHHQLVHDIEVQSKKIYKTHHMFRWNMTPSSGETHRTVKNTQAWLVYRSLKKRVAKIPHDAMCPRQFISRWQKKNLFFYGQFFKFRGTISRIKQFILYCTFLVLSTINSQHSVQQAIYIDIVVSRNFPQHFEQFLMAVFHHTSKADQITTKTEITPKVSEPSASGFQWKPATIHRPVWSVT